MREYIELSRQVRRQESATIVAYDSELAYHYPYSTATSNLILCSPKVCYF